MPKSKEPQVTSIIQTNAAQLRELKEARTRIVALVAQGPDFNDPILAEQVQKVRELESRSHARRTLEEYAKEFAAFERWCKPRHYTALPTTVDTLRLYLKDLSLGPTARTEKGRGVRSVGVAIAAIAFEHNVHGLISPHQSPHIKRILKGIRREKGLKPAQKAPVEQELLYQLIDAIDDDIRNFVPRCNDPGEDKRKSRLKDGYQKQMIGNQLQGLRDKALFCVCFGAALRRDEITSLRPEHISFVVGKGVRIFLKKSKGDQEQQGEWVSIPYDGGRACATKTLRAWLEGARIEFGPVFPSISQWGDLGAQLSGRDVARILKKRATQVGAPTTVLAGHSFRAGFATAAYKSGKPLSDIAQHMRHKRLDTTRAYIRGLEGFEHNPAEGLLKVSQSNSATSESPDQG